MTFSDANSQYSFNGHVCFLNWLGSVQQVRVVFLGAPRAAPLCDRIAITGISSGDEGGRTGRVHGTQRSSGMAHWTPKQHQWKCTQPPPNIPLEEFGRNWFFRWPRVAPLQQCWSTILRILKVVSAICITSKWHRWCFLIHFRFGATSSPSTTTLSTGRTPGPSTRTGSWMSRGSWWGWTTPSEGGQFVLSIWISPKHTEKTTPTFGQEVSLFFVQVLQVESFSCRKGYCVPSNFISTWSPLSQRRVLEPEKR